MSQGPGPDRGPDLNGGPDPDRRPELGQGPGTGGQPGPPWLAVIDMQRVFAEPASPWLAPRFAQIVAPVRELAGAFRPRVTFTRFVAPSAPTGAWRHYYDLWPFALQPPHARIYELVDELASQPGPTLDATTFSKWDAGLSAKVSGTLVLAGVSTDCCVLCTALAAADAGTAVYVVADACAGATDDSHAKALAIMRLYGPLVQVITLPQALRLAAGTDGASRARVQPPGP